VSSELFVLAGGGTLGWEIAAQELVAALGRCGAAAELVSVPRSPPVRTMMATDFAQARAARATARRLPEDRPIIYCSITAALLWPRPGAIWLDTLAAENRPGRHGVWQRVLERRRLRQATLVLTSSERSLAPLRPEQHAPSAVVPVPVEPSGALGARRDIAAVAYAGDPAKKRLDHILAAWRLARRDEETLVVAGAAGRGEPGVRFSGSLPRPEYRALLRRSRLFLAAPRIEDYGTAQLEALADGCLLVTTSARGPYPAREIARVLDPRLVGEDLAGAIRTALDDPVPAYAERARELLAPHRPEAVDLTLSERVLPVLLGAGPR